MPKHETPLFEKHPGQGPETKGRISAERVRQSAKDLATREEMRLMIAVNHYRRSKIHMAVVGLAAAAAEAGFLIMDGLNSISSEAEAGVALVLAGGVFIRSRYLQEKAENKLEELRREKSA